MAVRLVPLGEDPPRVPVRGDRRERLAEVRRVLKVRKPKGIRPAPVLWRVARGGRHDSARAHSWCAHRVDEGARPMRTLLGDVPMGLLFPKRQEHVTVYHGLVFHHRFEGVAFASALWPAIIATANAAALPFSVCIRLLAF